MKCISLWNDFIVDQENILTQPREGPHVLNKNSDLVMTILTLAINGYLSKNKQR